MKINPIFYLLIAIVIFIVCIVVNEIRFHCNYDQNRILYLEILKRCLSGFVYEDASYSNSFNYAVREEGADAPLTAFTMIGLKRLDNIQFCVEDILENGIEGDFIETGVWRGGAVIFMRSILKSYNVAHKTVWVADSFEGLPHPNLALYPADKNMDLDNETYLKVSLDTVKNNFKKFNMLDEQVKFLKGWFKDTLPHAPIRKLSLLRLDGDLYESTIDVLRALYPKLSIGGYVIVDDYGAWESCSKAVQDYRRYFHITDEIVRIDHTGIYWKKTE